MIKNFSIFIAFSLAISFMSFPCVKAETSIFEEAKPFDLYREKLSTFTFHSSAKITRKIEHATSTPKEADPSDENKEGDTKELTMAKPTEIQKDAETKIIVDPKRQIYLKRKTMTSDAPSELFLRGRLAFFRSQPTEKFQKVPYQNEFERWLNISLSEVLIFFRDEDWVKSSAVTAEGSRQCRTGDNGKLCFDAQTGLPVSGTLEKDLSERDQIGVQFEIGGKSENLSELSFPESAP